MRPAGAIDIGGTGTKLGIVAEDGTILGRRTISTRAHADPTSLMDATASSLRLILDARESQRNPVAGVGVSVAGFLDREHSAMVHNANLPAFHGFPLRHALEERLSLECRLEVDSNAAVVAEYRHGAGRGSTRLLSVTVGTGLGGGVVIDGKLLRYT